MSAYLGPVLGPLGPAAGPVVAGLTKRKFHVAMMVSAILTVVAGLRLMMIASAGFQPAYFHSPVGRMFSMGGGLAIVGFLVGMTVSRPAMMRAGALGQQLHGATDDATRSRLAAELEAARKRGVMGGSIVLLLLVLAVAAMAAARYMG